MGRAIAAGAAYFAVLFALGFVLGTARVLIVAPWLGAWGATLAELPIMLAASWIVCGRLVRRFAVAGRMPARLAMGLTAFVLLMIAELLLGTALFDRAAAAQIAEMTRGPGLAGLIGQMLFAAFPLLRRGGPDADPSSPFAPRRRRR